MLESMTGYGRGEVKAGGRTVTVEIKSFNSRYIEVRPRLPREYSDLEPKVSSFVKKRFKRGNVDVNLVIGEKTGERDTLIDMKKASSLYRQAKHLKKHFKLKGEIDINTFLRMRDLFYSGKENTPRLSFTAVENALSKACTTLKTMRRKEGKNLENDIKKRLGKIAVLVEKISSHRDLLFKGMMEKLNQRLSEIGTNVDLDPGRIEQEVVFYAAKADIAEEITRLESHITRMGEFLKSNVPAGRNIDFVVQEMNREVNTIGSKAQSGDITQYVVDLKGELERIREQAQNIE